MADQTGTRTLAESGAVPEVAAHAGAETHYHHGRPVSWVAVAIVTAGFIIGGISMVPSPKWWLFWTGTGIAVVGCLILAFSRTFDVDWY